MTLPIVGDYHKIRSVLVLIGYLIPLLNAGHPLDTAFNYIRENPDTAHLHPLATRWQMRLRHGDTLHRVISESLPENIPMQLPTGDIETAEALTYLHRYGNEKLEYVRVLANKLRYPALLGFSVFFLALMMIVAILPLYETFFSNLAVAPPAPFALTFALQHWITGEGRWLTVMGLSVFGIGLYLRQDVLFHRLSAFFFPSWPSDRLWTLAIQIKMGRSVRQLVEGSPLTTLPVSELGRQSIFQALATQWGLNAYHRALCTQADGSAAPAEHLLNVVHIIHRDYAERHLRQLDRLPLILLGVSALLVGLFLWMIFLPLLSAIQSLSQ